MFGEFVKQIRERQRLGLREFCMENGYDPSNWSKIEREVVAPPRDEGTLREWAKALGLKQGSEDWLKFFDYAAVDSGLIDADKDSGGPVAKTMASRFNNHKRVSELLLGVPVQCSATSCPNCCRCRSVAT